MDVDKPSLWKKVILWKKTLLTVLVPLVLLPLPIVSGTKEGKCGYLVLVMCTYWMTECLPLAATGCMPIIFLPLFGILSTEQVCNQYVAEAIVVGIGSIVVASAVEETNLHTRIALNTLNLMGTTPRWLTFGFMLSTSFLSMWMGPTPTVAMMIPIVEAVLNELQTAVALDDITISVIPDSGNSCQSNKRMESNTDDSLEGKHLSESSDSCESTEFEDERIAKRKLKLAMMLIIANSANIGGIGTLPVAAPNLIFKAVIERSFPRYKGFSFTSWMFFTVPILAISLPLTWAFIQAVYLRKRMNEDTEEQSEKIKNIIKKKCQALGSITLQEKEVICIALLLACLWFFRDPEFMKGWGTLFDQNIKINDATTTIAAASLLFLLPGQLGGAAPRRALLDWKTAEDKVPWGVMIMIGGGLALGRGAEDSGLASWIGKQLQGLGSLNTYVLTGLLTVLTAFLIEVAGNSAICTILLPVLAKLAELLKVNPILLMLPCAVAGNFASMLPVASGPNALAFQGGKMKVTDMVLPGLVTKLISVSATLAITFSLGASMFSFSSFPEWAGSSTNETLLSATTEAAFL